MAYPPRLFVDGSWYHVYSRGQRQEPLFFSPLDRIAYLSFLDRELERRGGVVGSYCLMINHVHLLIQMGETNLGEIFQTVHMKYAKYFNKKRNTVGHVFQGRPGMKIVLDDSYIRPLVGYIHLNPVEAGMVSSVEEFEWSSWRWFLEGESKLKRSVYPPGFERENQARMFREMTDAPKELPDGENYWGTQSEWDQMERRKEGREGRRFRERRGRKEKRDLAEAVVNGTEVTVEQLRGPSRKRNVTRKRQRAMSDMYEEGYGPTEIGKWFNRTPASVIQAHKKYSSDRNN